MAGRSRARLWETPWVPVKGREPALQSHPRSSCGPPRAVGLVLPPSPGPGALPQTWGGGSRSPPTQSWGWGSP